MEERRIAETIGYYDAVSDRRLHMMDAEAKDPDYGFKDDIRPHTPILGGMLLQVGVCILRYRNPFAGKETYVDLLRRDFLTSAGKFDEDSLREYIRGFTKTVIPLLDMDPGSVDYIWDNLERVIQYLVVRLRAGHLKFYKCFGGNKTPAEGAAVAFLDYSPGPESPVFLFPVFGLKKYRSGVGYVPWSPCPDDPKEPELKRLKRDDKTVESLPTGYS